VINTRLRLCIGALLLVLLAISIDWQGAASLRLPSLVALAALAALIACSTLLGAGAAWLLVAAPYGVPPLHFLSIYWRSWALGLIAPGQVGDVASMVISLRSDRAHWSRILARALLDKLISLGVTALLLMQFLALRPESLPVLERPTAVPEAAVLPLLLLLVAVPAVLLLVFLRERLQRYLNSSLLLVLREYRGMLLNAVLSLAKLLLTGFIYCYAFASVGQRLEYLDVLGLTTLLSLVAYVPITLNGVGTVEAMAAWLYGALGVSGAQVLAVFLVLRLVVMAVAWLPVLCLLPFRPAAESPR
jgi:uncharacterized membrane protein YbhN (UPF0104 family)